MTTPAPDDHDAWLSQALRHAPDADARPPAEVSEAILREARAKARTGGSAPEFAGRGIGWPRRLWHWLGRPGASASLAGVMVAMLVGVMWWNQPLPEPADAPAGSAAGPASPPSDRAESALPPAPTVLAENRRKPAPAAPSAAREPRSDEAIRQRLREAPVERAAPTAAAKQHGAPARLSGTAANHPPIAGLRAQIAAEAPRWSVRRGAGPARPVDAAVQTWLAELDAATSGAWTTEAAAGAPAEPAKADGESLTLLRDGQAMHTLQLGNTAVRWSIDSGSAAAGGRSWRALLPRARALRDSLALALPR